MPRRSFRIRLVAAGAASFLCMGPMMALQLDGGRCLGQAVESPKGPGVEKADLVLVNGRLWTATDSRRAAGRNDPDAEKKEPATAIAVVGDRIAAMGGDESIRAWIGAATRVIDAGGKRVIPGITDCHTHIVNGGLQLARLNLRDVKNREEFVKSVEAAAKTKKPGEWVLGGRWSVESWTDRRPPTKAWIDPVTGEMPTLLQRMDGHQALANSAALRAAGIDAKGPQDPPGGEIERDSVTREPTGILKESAMDLVESHIPPVSFDERYEALRRGMAHANSFGITSVHDMSELEHLEVFTRAHDVRAMTLRITSYLQVAEWPVHMDRVRNFPIQDDMFRLAGLKGYMDGSLGSRTAYMREPFADSAPDAKYPRGQLTAVAGAQDSFRLMVANAQNHGLQLAVHAIGDEANHLILDAYEYAAQLARGKAPRNRVEHAQHLLPEDIPRFAALGVTASMQPFHKADDGRYAEKALGAARLQGSYAFRGLLDAGALLCFGSDFPVVPLNPFLGIDAAVNARTLAGDVWLPEHSLTIEEALRAYTASPPRAIHREDRLGTLEPGKLADIVILANDPFALHKDRVGEVRVAQTILGGKVVFTQGE